MIWTGYFNFIDFYNIYSLNIEYSRSYNENQLKQL